MLQTWWSGSESAPDGFTVVSKKKIPYYAITRRVSITEVYSALRRGEDLK
jgi:hypothetical protein